MTNVDIAGVEKDDQRAGGFADDRVEQVKRVGGSFRLVRPGEGRVAPWP
jgi:hypothetical protein